MPGDCTIFCGVLDRMGSIVPNKPSLFLIPAQEVARTLHFGLHLLGRQNWAAAARGRHAAARGQTAAISCLRHRHHGLAVLQRPWHGTPAATGFGHGHSWSVIPVFVRERLSTVRVHVVCRRDVLGGSRRGPS